MIVPKYQDLAYATLSDAQKLDLYLPDGAGPFPLVVEVHGGAFKMGDKADAYRQPVIQPIVSHGYAVASLNYRLSGEALFPAQIHDVKTAVRWLRSHARELNLDARSMGVIGESAGAHLVSLLGTSCGAAALEGAELGWADQSSCVQAVVDWYGPIDFLTMDQQFEGTGARQDHNDADSPESLLVGAPIQARPDLVWPTNPINYITSHAPPFLIQHGTADVLIPPQQAQVFYDALCGAIGKDKVELTMISGAAHGVRDFINAENMQRVVSFFDRHLK